MENDARLRSRATVEILNSLAKNEPKGMGIWDLTRDPEVHIKDRTTMSKHCTYLANAGWIHKKNKHSPYRLTSKAFGDPEIRGYFFRREIVNGIMQMKIPPSQPNKFTKININIRKDPQVQRIFSDEMELFEFSNRIGALITCACIEAISPHKLNEKIAGWNVDESRLEIRGKDKDSASRQWIRHAINADYIFEEFCKLQIVKRGQAIYTPVPIKKFEAMVRHFGPGIKTEEQQKEAYKKYVEMKQRSHLSFRKFDPPHVDPVSGKKKGNPKWSRYEMDSDNLMKLRSAFDSVFPHLSKNLLTLKQTLQNKISEEKEWRKAEFGKENS